MSVCVPCLCQCPQRPEGILELQSVNHMVWVLATKSDYSERGVRTLNHWAISPTPKILFIFIFICVNASVSVCFGNAGVWRSIPWSWNCRELWAAKCGFLPHSMCLLKEQEAHLTIVLSLQPQIYLWGMIHVLWHICDGQRTNLGFVFFPYTIWVPGWPDEPS